MTARESILKALADHGPTSAADLYEILSIGARFMSKTLFQMGRKSPKFPRQVYVQDWAYDTNEGTARRYPRAVYALGDKRNANKPNRQSALVGNQRYRDRNKGQVNSIFNMGGSVRDRRAIHPLV